MADMSNDKDIWFTIETQPIDGKAANRKQYYSLETALLDFQRMECPEGGMYIVMHSGKNGVEDINPETGEPYVLAIMGQEEPEPADYPSMLWTTELMELYGDDPYWKNNKPAQEALTQMREIYEETPLLFAFKFERGGIEYTGIVNAEATEPGSEMTLCVFDKNGKLVDSSRGKIEKYDEQSIDKLFEVKNSINGLLTQNGIHIWECEHVDRREIPQEMKTIAADLGMGYEPNIENGDRNITNTNNVIVQPVENTISTRLLNRADLCGKRGRGEEYAMAQSLHYEQKEKSNELGLE